MPFVTIEADDIEGEIEGNVFEFLQEVAIELVNQLQIEAPVGATGDLRRSFEILKTGPQSIIVGSRLDYALDVQTGKPPHEVENFEALQAWARRKLGAESAAGPVFQKIKEEGTEPNPYVDRAIDNTLRKVT